MVRTRVIETLEKLSAGVATVLIMAFLSACSEPPAIERGQHELPEDAEIVDWKVGQYGGILVLNETTQPTSFNPLVPGNITTNLIQTRLLAALVEYDPRIQEFVPALAKSWDVSDDNLSYTFHLRRGSRWSDGEPVTADDVIFTFDCILAEVENDETGEVLPRFPSRYYQQLHINGEKLRYRKIDDYTVRFDLPAIYAPFIFDLSSQMILPKHRLKKHFDDDTFLKQWSTQTAIESPEEIIGTGPFVIRSYRPGERMVLTPNPHYRKADKEGKRLPYVDYFVMKFVTESNTAVAHFSTGKSDASGIGASDYEWVRQAAETYDFTIYDRGPSANVNFFWFNQHPGSNEEGERYLPEHKYRWFTDKRFRQAVQYGINRQGVINALLFGKGEPLTSIIPPAQGKWHNTDLPRYEYNPERSRELFREAGFSWDDDGQMVDSEGIPVEFTLLMTEGASADTIAVTFIENMKELGMKVNMERSDFATLLRRTDDTFDYDITFLGWGSSSAAYDPSGSKALYLSSGQYHQWYPSQPEPATEWEARIDELIGLQERTLDQEKRYEYMHEVQAIMADQLPLLYGYSPYAFVGVKNKWRNIYVPPAGTSLWNIDVVWEAQD